jgi:hypothetical protein
MVTLSVLTWRSWLPVIYKSALPVLFFGMPQVKVGIPSVVEAALLPGLIGMSRTRRFLCLAENIDAEEAEKLGLVDQAVWGETVLNVAVSERVGWLIVVGHKVIRS